jgi:branched-chain amino acid transport system substrate-binding protein
VFSKRFAFATAFVISAFSANAGTLVVAAPFEEFPELAAQMLDGTKAAANAGWDIKQVNAGCTEAKALGVAELILAEKPDTVIGLPCIESLVPALATLGPLNVPIITIGSRAEAPTTLALKNNWPLYRTGPREHEEGQEIAKLIVESWSSFPFAILDDGTVFARDTAAAIRSEAEFAELKPVLIDGFQPQLESQKKLIDRIVASGATHVFIASDRANIAQIATEAAGRGITFAGPETLLANDLDFPLPQNVLMVARNVVIDDEAMAKIAAVRQKPFALAEGYATDAYIATRIAMALPDDRSARTFDAGIGFMDFAEDNFIEPIFYEWFRYDGTAFQKVDE